MAPALSATETDQEKFFLQQLSDIYLDRLTNWFEHPLTGEVEPRWRDPVEGAIEFAGFARQIYIHRTATAEYPLYLADVEINQPTKLKGQVRPILIALTTAVPPLSTKQRQASKRTSGEMNTTREGMFVPPIPSKIQLLELWSSCYPNSKVALDLKNGTANESEVNQTITCASWSLWPHIEKYFMWEHELKREYSYNLGCLSHPAFPSWSIRRALLPSLENILERLRQRTEACPLKVWSESDDLDLYRDIANIELTFGRAAGIDVSNLIPKVNATGNGGRRGSKKGTGAEPFVLEICEEIIEDRPSLVEISREAFLAYLEAENPTDVLINSYHRFIQYDNQSKRASFSTLDKAIRKFNRTRGK